MLASTSFALIAGLIASAAAQAPQSTQAAPTSFATSVVQSGGSAAPAPPAPTGALIQIPVAEPRGFNVSTFVGSLVGIEAGLTTVAVGCTPEQQKRCFFIPEWTFRYGPSSMHYEASFFVKEGEPPITQDCKFGAQEAICTQQGILDFNGDTTVTTSTMTVPATAVDSMTVLVTAGAFTQLQTGGAAGLPLKRSGSVAAALMGLTAMYL